MAFKQTTDSPSTVFVVDDDLEVRRSLRSLLQSVGFHVEMFGSATEFSEYDLSSAQGCLVLDMRLPDRSGLEILEDASVRKHGLPVIIITAYGDVNSAVRAFKCDAFDFIEKPFNDQYFLGRVQHAIQLDQARRHVRDSIGNAASRMAAMTKRETSIIELIIQGLSTKMIAAELGIAHKTAENYRSRILKKMNAQNSADLVRLSLTAKIKTAEGMPPYRIYEELFPNKARS